MCASLRAFNYKFKKICAGQRKHICRLMWAFGCRSVTPDLGSPSLMADQGLARHCADCKGELTVNTYRVTVQMEKLTYSCNGNVALTLY